eukprot:gene6698-13581_t
MHVNKPLGTAVSSNTAWALIRSIFRVHWPSFLFLGLIKLISTLIMFVYPILLGKLVSFVDSNPSANEWTRGIELSFALAVSLIMSALLSSQSSYWTSILQIRVRGTLSLLIVSKSLQLPLHMWSSLSFSDSQASNLILVDVQRVADACMSIHDIWCLPMLIIIACYLLHTQVSEAFLAGVSVIALIVPVNAVVTSNIGKTTTKLMACKDKRTAILTDMLKAIKGVKMLGMEDIITKISMNFRHQEMKYLQKRKYLDAVCVFLWAATPVLVPCATFSTVVLMGGHLEPAAVFTALALLNMLIFPINALPWIINGLIDGFISCKRLGLHLHATDTLESYNGSSFCSNNSRSINLINNNNFNKQNDNNNDDEMCNGLPINNNNNNSVLEYTSSSGAESPLSSPLDILVFKSKPKPVVVVEVSAFQGHIYALCGGVGSGKSTLLLSLLGECRKVYGRGTDLQGMVSYCPQNPALFNDSIRNNILLESDFIETRYNSILHGTGLDVDLEASTWESSGDAVGVGSGGGKLSGGQRLRVGVARALYASTPIVILDDPFSALDSVTASNLMNFLKTCSQGLLNNGDGNDSGDDNGGTGSGSGGDHSRLILLATHSIHLLNGNNTDGILLLQNGKLVGNGSYDDLRRDSKIFLSLISSEEHHYHHQDTSTGKVNDIGSGIGTDSDTADDMEPVVVFSKVKSNSSVDGMESLIPCVHNNNNHNNDDDEDIDDDENKEENLDSRHPDTNTLPLVTTESSKSKSSVSSSLSIETTNDNEEMVHGNISLSVPLSYLSAIGWPMVLLVVMAMVVMQAVNTSSALWWAWWAERQDALSRDDFIGFVLGIFILVTLLALIRSFVFAYSGIIAARIMYNKMASAVLSAPLSFFESTPLGRLTNRFGRDTYNIDETLPFMINIVLATFFSLIGSCSVIVYSNIPVLIIIIIVGILYYRLQLFYRSSSRHLRRLESVYRSPLLALLSDCVASGVSLRAQGLVSVFEKKISIAIDDMQRVSFSAAVASQWLSVRMQLLGSIVTTSLALSSCLSVCFDLLPVSPGVLGLAMTYSLSVLGTLSALVSSLTEVELELVSVERVLEYSKLPKESDEDDNEDGDGDGINDVDEFMSYDKSLSEGIQSSLLYNTNGNNNNNNNNSIWNPIERSNDKSGLYETLLPKTKKKESIVKHTTFIPNVSHNIISQRLHFQWPRDGAISFRGMSLGYTTGVPLALKDINVDIPSGSRVAVVGRSGSGKSSLLRALLRLTPYNGSVIASGVELRHIPRKMLRRRLCVVPQDPLLFAGSVRMNLDPEEEHCDAKLLWSLEKCGLASTVKSGGGMSQGQRQLLSLARALLRASPIILIDEASSQLDRVSEDQLTIALRHHLDSVDISGGSTILMICHRKFGIRSLCNKELRLQEGRLVHFVDIASTVSSASGGKQDVDRMNVI